MNFNQDFEIVDIGPDEKMSVQDILITYKPLVRKLARQYYLVGGDIDDLVQEGMIGLFKATKSYELNKNASFKTYATLCIKRQMQTAVKKSLAQKNSVFRELFDNSSLEVNKIPSLKENPEQKIISKENLDYINAEIKRKLSKMEQKVLNEYLKGLSYESIANNLGLSKKSIDNALSRIRSKLTYLLDNN